MDKNFLLQITNELYRLTLLFPKKEPLRYKMREVADEILADYISLSQENPLLVNSTIVKNISEREKDLGDTYGKLEVLDGYFEVAKSQNWVKSSEILNIKREYIKVMEELRNYKLPLTFETEVRAPESKKTETGSLQVSIPTEEKVALVERQQKILEFLKENGRAQVWEIKKIFPQISKRTLRRDFESLLKQGIIERIGERNNTFYQLKGRTAVS